jgi:hypothetical protein
MKTFKSNRLEQAFKELKTIKDLSEESIEGLQTEFTLRERKKYHVALVRKENNPRLEKYDVSVSVQSYNERSFPKLKKSLKFLGISKIVLLHDPRNEDFEAKHIPTIDERKESNKAVLELMKKQKDEIAELKKELAAKNAGKTEEDPIFDVEKAVKADLIAFAGINEIDLGESLKVEEIRTVVKDWSESQA